VKLCDKCFKNGDYKPSVKTITTSTHETFDLCESCYQGLVDYIQVKDKPVELLIVQPVKKKTRRKKR